MSFVKTFKEDGTESNKLLPVQEKKKEKNRLYVRFMALLLLTNSITYLILAPTNSPVVLEAKEEITAPVNHIEMILPLSLHTPLNTKVNAVTIIDSRDKVICKKAFVVAEENKKVNPFEDDLIPSFRVFIHEKDLPTLMQKEELKLRAYPFSSSIVSRKKRKVYEVHF